MLSLSIFFFFRFSLCFTFCLHFLFVHLAFPRVSFVVFAFLFLSFTFSLVFTLASTVCVSRFFVLECFFFVFGRLTQEVLGHIQKENEYTQKNMEHLKDLREDLYKVWLMCTTSCFMLAVAVVVVVVLILMLAVVLVLGGDDTAPVAGVGRGDWVFAVVFAAAPVAVVVVAVVAFFFVVVV